MGIILSPCKNYFLFLFFNNYEVRNYALFYQRACSADHLLVWNWDWVFFEIEYFAEDSEGQSKNVRSLILTLYYLTMLLWILFFLNHF